MASYGATPINQTPQRVSSIQKGITSAKSQDRSNAQIQNRGMANSGTSYYSGR